MLNEEKPVRELGSDRILAVEDVCAIMGCCPVAAAKIMKESGRCLRVHRRLYVLESAFVKHLESEGVLCDVAR